MLPVRQLVSFGLVSKGDSHMNSRKTLRMISVVAAVCLLQVYVFAGATTPNVVATNPNATSNANSLILGRLILAETESVLVNGNSAKAGTTIFSGSQLQTPDDVEAIVVLGSAGTLYIQPNTNLTVTFDKTSVNVKVAAGSAFVAANAGVTSSVTTPDGKTTAGEPGAIPAPKMSQKSKKGWIWGGVVAGAVVVIVIVLVTRNSSP
jgi:hypothetical protein